MLSSQAYRLQMLVLSIFNSILKVTFYWDAARGGQGITVTDNKTRVFLKESAYMFRSIISDTVKNR
jgi:hypothetical protein